MQKPDLFEMEPAEFDAWLANATRSDFLKTANIVTAKLSGGQTKLSPEEIRRITAYRNKLKAICLPVIMLTWFATELPIWLIDAFQLYLISGKLFGFGPFCHMSWGITLLPTIISIACLTYFAALDAPRGK